MKSLPIWDLFWLGSSLTGFLFFCAMFPTNPMYSSLNGLLGAILLIFVFLSGRNPYDLRQIFYLSNFVFLVLAARMDKSLGLLYWGTSPTALEHYESVAMMAIIATFLFAIMHRIGNRISGTSVSRHLHLKLGNQRTISGPSLVLLSLFSVIIIFQQNGWQIDSVFFRSGVAGARQQSSQMVTLLYNVSVFQLPTICLVVYLLHGRRSFLITASLVAFFLIGNPPTGMARWQAAMLYGAVAISGFPRLSSHRHFFAFMLFIGLFLVFPILDAFRNYTEDVRIRLSTDWFTAGHFDSAQSIARAIDLEFVTYGQQLLGVLLFFVPRALWSDKPTGSGHTVAGVLDLNFDNISMHILGEGYVNFGYLGIALFALFIGFVFGAMDKRAWNDRSHRPVLAASYPFLVGWVFFFVRGDLMNSFAGITGTIVTINAVYFLTAELSRLSFGRRSVFKRAS